MALTFGAATSDRVNHGTGNANLSPFTLLLWIFPTTLNTNDAIAHRGTFAANNRRSFFQSDSSGNLQLSVDRSTTDTIYITNDAPLVLNEWNFVAASFDSSAGAGEIANIYRGSLTALVTERAYGTATDGSGTLADDSAASFIVGNIANFTTAFKGRIAIAAYVLGAWSLAQIQAWQFRPRMVDGIKLLAVYGYAGTGTQPDWSGNANNGTVTGATVADHVPIPFRRSGPLYVPYTVAALGNTWPGYQSASGWY